MFKKLFIHVPKNGGMSVRHNQSQFRPFLVLPDQNNVYPDNEIKSQFMRKMRQMRRPNVPWQHARWRDIDPKVSLLHESFAVARNPWDRVVSRYTFSLSTNGEHDKFKFRGKRVGGVGTSFEEFLEQRFQYDEGQGECDDEFTWHLAIRGWCPFWDYVTDKRGRVRCDVLRFEHFDNDVCRYFNVPVRPVDIRNVSNGDKSDDLKRISNKKPYQDFYNDKTIQIVADWYKKDIDTFGFDFDTAATKNIWYNS